MSTALALDWKQAMTHLGPAFAGRAATYDCADTFIAENYADMREAKFFSAMVPQEFGGGGVPYAAVCSLIREMGRCCGSTALTFSMHQHLIAAALWNQKHSKPGEKLLRSVADGEKILVSTGATDWLTSNGILVRCEGGYRFTARKVFASGCLAGNLLITSGRYNDPAAGDQVLHFPVPMSAQGVRIERDWKTMGMRGTGSHTVVLEDVFVPEPAIALRRPCGKYHPVWNVILTVALPLICAAYVGVAEAAAEMARRSTAQKGDDGFNSFILGEMENELCTAQMALESMIANVNDLDTEIGIQHANFSLIRKTIVAQAVQHTAGKALEATGGGGYFRSSGIERFLRDAQAVQFHPLQEKRQHRFSGRLAMGLEPVAPEP